MTEYREPDLYDPEPNEPEEPRALSRREEREERRRAEGKLAYEPPKTGGFAAIVFALVLIGAGVAWFTVGQDFFSGSDVQLEASQALEDVGNGLRGETEAPVAEPADTAVNETEESPS